MKPCSIHHWILFFLLVIPTAVSLVVSTVKAKRNQPITLTCESTNVDLVQWTVNNHEVVVAECDQISCRLMKDGFETSHDQYLNGIYTLTITDPDYSKRNTYVCECYDSNYRIFIPRCKQRLTIEPVTLSVQLKSGEDLVMNLPINETMKVIYAKDLAGSGDKGICWRNSGSVECGSDYTARVSFNYPNLTLRGMTGSDSGVYTIRDTQYDENIHIYTVAVEEGMSWWLIALVVLLPMLAVIGPVLLVLWIKRKKLLIVKVCNKLASVDEIIQKYINQAVEVTSGEISDYAEELEQLKTLKCEMDEMMHWPKDKWMWDWYINNITDMEELILYYSNEKWFNKKKSVEESIQLCLYESARGNDVPSSSCTALMEHLAQMAAELDQMEQQWSRRGVRIEVQGWFRHWCFQKHNELHRINLQHTEEGKHMVSVDIRIQEYVTQALEVMSGEISDYNEELEQLRKMKREMNEMKQQHSDESAGAKCVLDWYIKNIIDMEELVLFYSNEEWFSKKITVEQHIQQYLFEATQSNEASASTCVELIEEVEHWDADLGKMELEWNSESCKRRGRGWIRRWCCKKKDELKEIKQQHTEDPEEQCLLSTTV